ncbi:LysR family transcriptional regulator [Pandoraea nosoerga]|uniref:LysR family transcriptional regulator n=1 Tax=Pandoraea nosoerga TaxID=2508296 RepID=A0A5E4WQ22_9BURK|nr:MULTISPECIES: LysR family transcriptional regulator [Pandoraea]MBN4666914.1 LysR family transcriptional regulator [Pandoraea nosoerga]MBN4677045.1 LysR family transcriptional regulator [Pandoraea nosoerga]MBN4681714.1 LysR family transcriptional regulator [Pandoraea nosoerga]MBN4744940.1 LysR family transcriptional regulator [Pandoraea nosoerga]VVE25116.1 LysR family transcriptional regulator [Pandoraea nosoerga]
MDLRQLRYFVAVAEERHFGRAAQRLSMTQPPLSQQIRALETSLGAPLFVRTNRSVELTAVGRQLLPEVRRVLADADALPALAQGLAHGEVGTLSLGFVSTADYGVLPPLLREFGERYPRVRLQLLEATSDVQVEALMDGRIDAGLFIPPVPARYASELSYLPIVREPLMLALPAGKGEAATGADGLPSGTVSLADYADEPLVIFPRRVAPAFYDIIMECYAALGLTPRVGQEAIQMQTIVSLVSAGMGVALVPQSLCHLRRTGVTYRSLRETSALIETGLLWRTAEVTPVLEGFLQTARGIALTPPGAMLAG